MSEPLNVLYRITFNDEADEGKQLLIELNGNLTPQRVAEAVAQGLRDYGGFTDVTLTRSEHQVRELAF